jgi:hypothetical protein
MPLPILGTLATGAATAGRAVVSGTAAAGRGIATGAATAGRAVVSGTAAAGRGITIGSRHAIDFGKSMKEGVGGLIKRNSDSSSSLAEIPKNIGGKNSVTVEPKPKNDTPSLDKINPPVEQKLGLNSSGENTAITEEGDQTQAAITKEGDQTQAAITKEGDQTQAAITKEGDQTQQKIRTLTNRIVEENRNNRVSETQNERGQVQRHRELISAINDCSLGKLNSSAKNGMGISNTKSEDSPILRTLMSFIPMLLPVLVPLLGLVAPLLPILAAIATGVGLGALLAKWIGGNNVFEDAYEGAKQFLQTGSITGDVEERQRVFDQSLEADRRNARNNISDTSLKESQSDIANQTAVYQRPDLFGIKDQISDTGEFKDITKREEAFNVASNILSSFKTALDEYKGKIRTTGGREVFSEKIKPYVLEVWPRYETTMKRAGLDPLKEAPGEFAEYAPALEYNDIKSEKSDAQVSRVAQTIAETGPKNWKSMGVSVRNVEKVSEFNDTVKDTVKESSTQTVSDSEVKSVTETGNIAAKQQDIEVNVPDSAQEGKGGNVNIALTSQGGGSTTTATPSASPENQASRASGGTIKDARIVAASVDLYQRGSTYSSSSEEVA